MTGTRRCRRLAAWLAAVGLCGSVVNAAAVEPTASAVLRLSSEYVTRSYSKSAGRAVAQANLDLSWSDRWFAGAWLSQVHLGDARLEASPYVGARVALGPDWAAALSASGYLYDRAIYGRSADYAELEATLLYRDRVSLQLGVAPDSYGRGGDPVHARLRARHTLGRRLELSAGFGYESTRRVFGYDFLYWDIGVSAYLHRHVTLDLRYVDAGSVQDVSCGGARYCRRVGRIERPIQASIVIGY